MGWSLDARYNGHLETMYWASREHVLGTGCPHHGHRVPNVWGYFGAYYNGNDTYYNGNDLWNVTEY